MSSDNVGNHAPRDGDGDGVAAEILNALRSN